MAFRGDGACIALVVLGIGGPGLHAQTLTYTGGAYYAGGSYIFDTRSDAFYLSNGLRFGLGRLELGFSVPVVTQNGGVVTRVADGVPLPTGGSESGVVARRQGGRSVGTRRHDMGSTPTDSTVVFNEGYSTDFGDPTLSASGEVYSGFGLVRSLRLDATAKAPLTDVESGVGSGEWDIGVGGSMTVAAASSLLFADVSYWWLGDLPDLELANGVSYGAGVTFPVSPISILLMVSGMSRTIDTMAAPVSLLGSVSRSVGERGFVSGGLGVGLTESAPDLAVHLGWSFRLLG